VLNKVDIGKHNSGYYFAMILLWTAVILAFINWTSVVMADSIMQKIKNRGAIRIGFQEDVAPFSWYDEKSRVHRGFSIDMAGLLAEFLSKRFDQRIHIEVINLKAVQRIKMITSGAVDLEMGASTQTCDREKQVDFSLIFFASETTFIVSKESLITDIQALKEKKIAAGHGTTNLQLLEQLSRSRRLPVEQIVAFETHDLAMDALVSGRVDAYCADRVLLATKRMQASNPEQWVILEDAIGYEPYAFMIPEGNSDFRDFVNNTIRWSILNGKYFDIYEKWMGSSGIGSFKMPLSFKEYLNVITYPMTDEWWQN
jgi:ABC-type amino acid transport substrate-binding protein